MSFSSSLFSLSILSSFHLHSPSSMIDTLPFIPTVLPPTFTLPLSLPLLPFQLTFYPSTFVQSDLLYLIRSYASSPSSLDTFTPVSCSSFPGNRRARTPSAPPFTVVPTTPIQRAPLASSPIPAWISLLPASRAPASPLPAYRFPTARMLAFFATTPLTPTSQTAPCRSCYITTRTRRRRFDNRTRIPQYRTLPA